MINLRTCHVKAPLSLTLNCFACSCLTPFPIVITPNCKTGQVTFSKEQAAKGNGDRVKALKAIKHRERMKCDYASIRRGYGKQKSGLATLDVPDADTGGRRLLTTAEDIHTYLLKRNEAHYSQATYTTFGDAGPGFEYINPVRPDSDANIDAMLAGNFEPWDTASTAVREFLQELQCTVQNELKTKLFLGDFVSLFKTIPENTASSVSDRHYGHYRVLSQLDDDTYIRVLFDIMNIAFVTHSPLPRWKYATQLMLEKGKGPGIENLRIIQLLEADMNWLLRFLWGKQLDRHALQEGAYNEAQFASPGKLCQSAIVNKVLFFDLLRQSRQCGALMDNDATAAFDRVLPALCVVTCRQLGMPKEAQRFFFKLLRQMEFTVTTAHGMSNATYAANANPKAPGQGVIQGGGASLPNYKSQQHPVIKAYEKHCIPSVFRHASKLQRIFRRWVTGFSDDISLMVNEFGVKLAGSDSDLPIAQRVRNALQSNLQRYEEYFFTAGGSLNLKKCFYYLVAFQWTGTGWRYQSNADIDISPVMIIPTTLDNSGTPQFVTWCEANEAQRTLGSFLAPDGSFFRQLDILRGHLNDWRQCLRNLKATQLNAKWRSFQTVFLKKLLYPLIGHSCGESDLTWLQQPVDKEVLHIVGLNEHFPRAVLHAPLLYGGFGCPTVHAQHVVEKVLLFLHHIREGGQIRESLLYSMSMTQIECGMSIPFFQLPATKWAHLTTNTWVQHIWRECSERGINIQFHTSVFWVPKASREHDRCIMEVAAELYEEQQLYQINMCRLALQVIYFSDITAVDGRRLLLSYYNGAGHSASGRRTRLNWPPIGELPAKWWDQWKEFLTRWCGTALRLPQPLGGWWEGREHLTLCSYFLYQNRLIRQSKDSYYEFSPVTPKGTTRFHGQERPFDELHLLQQAYVVDITFRNDYIYVVSRSPQHIISTAQAPAARTLLDLHRNLSPEVQRIIGEIDWPTLPNLLNLVESVKEGTVFGVSDGSVRNVEGRASHAWVIQAPNGVEIIGRGPVDGPSEARTSHRAELQGHTAMFLVFSLLVQYFHLIGVKLATFCDNQAVVSKLQSGWRQWRFRHTKGPDGDLQALLRKTLNDLESKANFSYQTEWVKAHQDESTDVRALPRQVALNVRMDTETKHAYDLPQQWQTLTYVPVLKAEGCAIYFGDRKITSNLHLSMLERWHENEAREYLSSCHGISTKIFDTIYWQALRFALKKLSPHRRATAVKALHRHLPTQGKLHKQGRVTMTSICPRCLAEEETNSHVYCCPHPDAIKQRKADWVEVWKQLHKQRTASIIEQTWRHFLQPLIGIPSGTSVVEHLPTTHGDVAAILQLAVQEQSSIGWDKLLVGMGSAAWKTLQEIIDAANPRPPKRSAADWMNASVRQLIKFSIRCWKFRNITIHGSTRQEQSQSALQKVREQILTLYRNPPDLAPRYRSIFEVPLEHRLKMPLQVAERWLHQISHQARVTQHNTRLLLRQHQSMQSHLRTMRRVARQQAKDRNLPATPRKAHRRAVQAANKTMREKLYAKQSQPTSTSDVRQRTSTRSSRRKPNRDRRGTTRQVPTCPPFRRHPP